MPNQALEPTCDNVLRYGSSVGCKRLNFSVRPTPEAPPVMPDYRKIISDYVALHDSGSCDDAFHGLIDHGADIVPDLIWAYEDTDRPDTKAFLIAVVSYLRRPDSADFLRHALRRDDPAIWKSALDGLVSLRAAEDLEHVLDSVLDEPKRSWIVEAISQCRETHDAP